MFNYYQFKLRTISFFAIVEDDNMVEIRIRSLKSIIFMIWVLGFRF